jgi:hypothetical protein
MRCASVSLCILPGIAQCCSVLLLLQLMRAIQLLAEVYEGAKEWKKAGFARTSFKFDQHRSACPALRAVCSFFV